MFASFFGSEPGAALTAQRCLSAPCAARERSIVPSEAPFTASSRLSGRGLWSEAFFGPRASRDPEAWGVIELPVPLLHPAIVEPIAVALGLSTADVVALATERAWLGSDGVVQVPPGHPGVASPLDTTVFEWPPEPAYPTVELWRTALNLREGAEYAPWLEAWERDRGFDSAAYVIAGDAWREDAENATGTETLLRALVERVGAHEAECLLVHRVPVPPVTARPLEERVGGFIGVGARDVCFSALADRAGRLARLLELEAPPIIVRSEKRALTEAFERLLQVWLGEDGPPPPLHEDPCVCEGPPAAEPRLMFDEGTDLTGVRGIAFMGEGKALIDFATASIPLELETGALGDSFRTAGRDLVGGVDGHAVYAENDTWRFAVWKESWLVGPLPSFIPFVFHESNEGAYVIEVGTRRIRRLEAVSDYPTQLLVTPCGRYFYASDKHGSGGVFRHDGQFQFPIEIRNRNRSVPVLRQTGAIERLDEDTETELEEVWASESLRAVALAESRDTWVRIQGGGLVVGMELVLRLDSAICAAAFNRACDQALLATAETLFWLDLDPAPRLRKSFDLRPVFPLCLEAADRVAQGVHAPERLEPRR